MGGPRGKQGQTSVKQALWQAFQKALYSITSLFETDNFPLSMVGPQEGKARPLVKSEFLAGLQKSAGQYYILIENDAFFWSASGAPQESKARPP